MSSVSGLKQIIQQQTTTLCSRPSKFFNALEIGGFRDVGNNEPRRRALVRIAFAFSLAGKGKML